MRNLMKFGHFSLLLGATLLLQSCDVIEDIEYKAEVINNYQQRGLELARQNRLLQKQINDLKYDIKKLEANNNFLQVKLEKAEGGRSPAALNKVKTFVADPSNDLVNFTTYQWTEDKLLKLAMVEFSKNSFEKSSQYFKTLMEVYPNSELIDDKVMFQSGLAFYKSGKYFKWSENTFNKLIKENPNSQFFRKAKLWLGLNYFKEGDSKKFYSVVEEFRLKYRNTEEWKLLSIHYEEFTNRFQ